MATNGILDITTEEYMGRDPEMQIDQDEMIEIIKTLQVVGVPQDQHPEILEAFKEWKQTNAGTVDMFLEASFQLEPGTITKIKSQQMAESPQDMQSEEEMSIPLESDDMREIMQSVGAPQRAAEGGIMGEEFTKDMFNTGPVDRYEKEELAIIQEFMKRFPGMYTENMELKDMMAMLQAEGAMGVEGLGLSGLDQSLDMITPESVENSLQRISRGDTQYGEMAQGGRTGYGMGSAVAKNKMIEDLYRDFKNSPAYLRKPKTLEQFMADFLFEGDEYSGYKKGGRAGYANGDVILPQPKPRYFERGDGSTRGMMEAARGMMGVNQNDPRYSAMGMNLGTGAPEIYPEPRPMVPYMAQEQMQPFTGGVASVMPAGLSPFTGQEGSFGQANDMSVQGMENVDMRVVMDFLMKMGMEPNQENIEKAIEALGAAAQYGQAVEDVNVDVDETIDMGYQHGGRAGYGLGSFVKSIFKAPKKIFKTVKKIAKSPLGKAAMAYLATAGVAGIGQGQGFRRFMPGTFMENIGTLGQAAKRKIPFMNVSKTGAQAAAESLTTEQALGKKIRANAIEKGLDASDFWKLSNAAGEVPTPWYKDPWKMIPAMSIGAGLYTKANPGNTDLGALSEGRDEEVAEWDDWLASIGQNPSLYNFGRETTMPFPDYAEGGRINRAEGGIMDLDGMEKDFRNTGGFVDLGAKEKADDVPARLSVNEFVMTADAVRGAGDGDVDEGAERLQRTMKQLEQKGKRHKAAQGMFATSQRLGEVI